MGSQEREQHPTNLFTVERVELYRDQPLGKGSYGMVIRAKCNELPCAAKLLHPIFFQFADPGCQDAVRRFQRECDFMSTIHHPNIVQCLGTHRDPESGLPVLLMELMDESLTQFLDRSRGPLAFHIQVDICHDIALALACLHSRDMIHRDLSSNNILLLAGSRAKVTDFGMSKLITTHAHLTPLTQCPGCPVFMPPEALLEPPCYTAKLDSFSLGVIGVQTITRRFPEPGPRMATVDDPRSPIGVIQIPVSEIERRKGDIDRISDYHLLKPLLLQCLNDSHRNRPSAVELCDQLGGLKESRAYSESRQLARDVAQAPETEELRQLHDELAEKDMIINQLQEELLNCQVQETGSDNRDDVIQETGNDNHDDVIQETGSDGHDDVIQEEIVENAAASVTIGRQTSSDGDSEIGLVSPTSSLGRDIRFSWQRLKDAPSGINRGCIAVDGNKAYFNDGSSLIYCYNLQEDSWVEMPKCSHKHFGMVVIDGRLTVVGGLYSHDCLLTLSDDGKWAEEFPPMITPRENPTVVHDHRNKMVVVAGGKETGATSMTPSVEVMDTDSKRWSIAEPFPYPLESVSSAVCGDSLYILGDRWLWSSQMIVCSLLKLKTQSSEPGSQQTTSLHRSLAWEVVTAPPTYSSTCTSVRGELQAVGGHSGYHWQPKSEVYRYDRRSNSWEIISYLPTPRYSTSVAPMPRNRLVIAGGYSGLFSTPSTLVEMLQL